MFAYKENSGCQYNVYKCGIGFSFFPWLQMFEKAVKLYSELADVAVKSFLISKDSPVLEPVRIHNGAEENKEAFRKFRGEEDEDFQILEYQAEKGNAGAMYRMGLFYYFGLRGLRRDHAKAFNWFLKAVEKGEPRSMEVLGEIYARGAGVERNYTKALEWLTLASRQELYSAYNGLGYLYIKGYGVEERNYTKVRLNASFPTDHRLLFASAIYICICDRVVYKIISVLKLFTECSLRNFSCSHKSSVYGLSIIVGVLGFQRLPVSL